MWPTKQIKNKHDGVMLCFPVKKRLAFRNLVQVPKVWSYFICASFLVHIPQVRPFFILLEFCARVDNSAKLSTIKYPIKHSLQWF